MFGQEPGKERAQGVLNQHVVSKLDAGDLSYFVLHTRAESARSVLITALGDHYRAQKPDRTKAQVDELVFQLVTQINDEHTYVTAREYERVKDEEVIAPGASVSATLESIVNAATRSCVIGVKKVSP